jgi:hypothetical protein
VYKKCKKEEPPEKKEHFIQEGGGSVSLSFAHPKKLTPTVEEEMQTKTHTHFKFHYYSEAFFLKCFFCSMLPEFSQYLSYLR